MCQLLLAFHTKNMDFVERMPIEWKTDELADTICCRSAVFHIHV